MSYTTGKDLAALTRRIRRVLAPLDLPRVIRATPGLNGWGEFSAQIDTPMGPHGIRATVFGTDSVTVAFTVDTATGAAIMAAYEHLITSSAKPDVPALTVLREAERALSRIVAAAPKTEPECPEGADTDAAESYGIAQGAWDAAELARPALLSTRTALKQAVKPTATERIGHDLS